VFDVRIKKISQNIEYRIVSNLTASNKMFKFETELSQNRTLTAKTAALKFKVSSAPCMRHVVKSNVQCMFIIQNELRKVMV
jgi:hypothetical protein